MGEIADMMIDGTMCEGCGEWLHGGADGPGYPGLCYSCRRIGKSDDESASPSRSAAPRNSLKAKCPTCGVYVKAVGLKDHQRAVHGVRT